MDEDPVAMVVAVSGIGMVLFLAVLALCAPDSDDE
jgi:hypothetical protein